MKTKQLEDILSKSAYYRSYIPYIYYLWVDNVLSPGEWNVLKAKIKKDENLSREERKELMTYLEEGNSPDEATFKKWRKWLNSKNTSIKPTDDYPLANYAGKISGREDLEMLKEIEIALDLRPSVYKHVFDTDRELAESLSDEDKNALSDIFHTKCKTDLSSLDDELSDEIFNWEIIRDKEILREKTLAQLKHLAKDGYGGLSFPKDHGGTDDLAAYGVLFEKLVAIDPSLAVKYGVQFGLFGGSIVNLGTEKHHKKWLKDISEAKLLGGFAMTETSHGSNVRGLQTRATYVEEEDKIYIHTPTPNDNKEYIGNAMHAEMVTVFARLIVKGENHGVHAIVVPVRDKDGNLLEGVRIEDNGYKLGLNGVDNGKIWFDNVAVPRFNLLNRFGSINDEGEYESPIKSAGKRFFTMLGTLVGGRICVAKGALSGAQFSLKVAVEYAMRRRQFGPDSQRNEELLMDYPSHQLRLIPRVARTMTMKVAIDKAMQEFIEKKDGDTRKIESKVAALKSAITWFSNRTIQECREACGGKGYLLENRIADMKGDIDIFTTFEGDNTVLSQLAAKGVLSEFQSQFSDGGFKSIIKFLGVQAQSRISSLNPIYSRKTDHEHLRNPKFHMHAVNYRLEELTLSISERMRALLNRRINPYEAFLRVQPHVLAVGEAYADKLEVDSFYEYIEDNFSLANDAYPEIIHNLAALSSLTIISNRKAWYLEKGYINASKSKAIRTQIKELSAEIRPFLPDVMEAMDVKATEIS